MIHLPQEWQKCSTSYVVRRLLEQAEVIGQYERAARAMVRGSLEFMLAGPRWVGRQDLLRPHEMGWQLKNWLFVVLPRVDDKVLLGLEQIPRWRCDVDLLAPPWAVQIARYAVRAILPHSRVDVYAIDGYIDLRILWTSIDLDLKHAAAMIDLLRRYRQFVETTPEIGIQHLELPARD